MTEGVSSPGISAYKLNYSFSSYPHLYNTYVYTYTRIYVYFSIHLFMGTCVYHILAVTYKSKFTCS